MSVPNYLRFVSPRNSGAIIRSNAMAVSPLPVGLELRDLRDVRGRELRPLLDAEQNEWREHLRWDYRASAEMIVKHAESRTLPGCAALWNGRVIGYCFYVAEDTKGLIGDLYVHPDSRREPAITSGGVGGVATRLVERVLDLLEQAPALRRIEAQLIAFGVEPLGRVFLGRGFESFPRLFLFAETGAFGRVTAALGAEPEIPAIEMRPWKDTYFDEMAELIVDSYSGHVDTRINNQYRDAAGALRFLKNIIVFPGCGLFQAGGSWVAAESGSGRMVGAVLSSQVAPRVGHVTQICVRRDWQGKGLGRWLMLRAMRAFQTSGFEGVSLTVTAENAVALKLYRQLGFEMLKGFAAFARDLPAS